MDPVRCTRRAVVSVAAALLLAGCSGDDGGTARPSQATTTAAPRATVSSLVATVSSDRIAASLQAVVAVRVTAEERSAARQVIRDELAAAGVEAREDAFGDDGVNVIGRIEGRDPSAPAIVVSAHYDTVPGSPGADDNGSGVAAVLELARVFGRTDPAVPIELTFFDLEERGLLGSRHRSATAPAAAGVFNFDMIGYSCGVPGCQFVFPDISGCMDVDGATDVGVGIAAVANRRSEALLATFVQAATAHVPDLELGTARLEDNGECLADTRRSDHAPYWDAGVPAVFLTDTANFRNPHYHRPSDTLDTVDEALVAKVTRATAAAVAELAGFGA